LSHFFQEKEKGGEGRSKAWWPMKREGEASNARRPMEGEGETSFSPFSTSPPQATYLGLYPFTLTS